MISYTTTENMIVITDLFFHSFNMFTGYLLGDMHYLSPQTHEWTK